MVKIKEGRVPQPRDTGSNRTGKYSLPTHDPAAYRVTLHPSLTPEGFTNLFYELAVFENLYAHTQGVMQIKQLAPGVGLTAAFNEPNIRTHLGVGGEIVRTFPLERRGTITLNLYSNGDEARTISEMFVAASNVSAPLHSQISPIERIEVTTDLAEVTNAILVRGEDCWLVEVPTFTIGSDVSVASFVFDCATLHISHGAPAKEKETSSAQ